MVPALRSFHVLALLEASRLEEQGDMAGAWGWYRTALRASTTSACTGSDPSVIAHDWRGELLNRLTDWSADQRTTPAMLRRRSTKWSRAARSLRRMLHDQGRVSGRHAMLDSPRNPGHTSPLKRLLDIFGSPEYRLSPEQIQAIVDAWRFWSASRSGAVG